MHRKRASVTLPTIFWPLLGLGIVLAADGATALVLSTTVPWAKKSLSILYLAAPMAALLVGLPAWFFFIVTPGCVTIGRGMLVGVVGSLIAHPVMWIFLCLAAVFMPQPVTSLSFLVPTIDLSLIYGGWATTPIGALAGVLFIALQRVLLRAHGNEVGRR